MHRSEQVWMEPEKFRPARFLNKQNELINLDKIMPFGFGELHLKELKIGYFFVTYVTFFR